MKKILSLCLAIALVFGLVGCGCDHQWQAATCTSPKTCTLCNKTEGNVADHAPQQWVVSAVDTAALTMTKELTCQTCGLVLETATESTGSAPVNSLIAVSPNEWYQCLLTNIQLNGLGQSLYDYPVEAEDDALLCGLVTMTKMMAVFSFMDAEGNTITTEQADLRGNVHNIRLEAQFNNDNAREFYLLLMILSINNNSGLVPEDANTLAGQVMSGAVVTDNGFTYAMEIVSVEEHRVCVSITAE